MVATRPKAYKKESPHNYDNVIYRQMDGKFIKVGEPKGNVDNPNFLVTYQGLDWSGFGTLNDTMKYIPSLEKRTGCNDFDIIER